MKKFMKTCAVLALIMFMLGLGIAFGVRMMYGPVRFSDFMDGADIKNDIGRNIVSKLEEMDSGVRYDIEDKLDFDDNNPTFKDDTEQDFSSDLVKNLDVEIGACALEIMDSEDDDFHIKTEKIGVYQGYVSDSTLHIKGIRKTSISGSGHGTIKLFIPKDFVFGEVDFEVGAGYIESDSSLYASEMDIELGAGEMELPYVSVGELDAAVGAGSLQLDGDIRTYADLQCAMGNVDMKIAGKESDCLIMKLRPVPLRYA